jgi:hypothetical protein
MEKFIIRHKRKQDDDASTRNQFETESLGGELGSYATDDCVLMDTYRTRNPCQNDMFTNSNKAFINFNNFLK